MHRNFLFSGSLGSLDPGNLKVLTYHRVNIIDTDPLTVKTEMFLRQLDYLEDRGFNFISPEALYQDSAPCTGPYTQRGIGQRGEGVPCTQRGTGVLLSFDHGFSTDYDVIYPLLKAKKYPAIFFLITDLIGKSGMLGFDEVRSLQRSGFSIGSHSVSHPYLTRISLSQARQEIEGSKKFLEDRLGEKVDFFSYPYGDVNEDIIKVVKEAGYKSAFLSSPWRRKVRRSKFTIPRCGIYQGTNFLLFKLKML